MSSALVITVDGTVAELEMPETDTHLGFFYRVMGCDTVDVVRLADGMDMWIDDYGMELQPVNPLATWLARGFGHLAQPYFGTVLVCGVDGPETVGLDPRRTRMLCRFLNAIAGVLG